LAFRSLSKIIFAYSTEASIDNRVYDFLAYNHDPSQFGGVNGILTRFSVEFEDLKITLTKISQIREEKKDVLSK